MQGRIWSGTNITFANYAEHFFDYDSIWVQDKLASGTPVYAALSSTVSFTGVSSVFGNYIIIKHTGGYQTLYAHLSKIYVKKGQWVDQKVKIGAVGSTGYSTGPHLHFTVYKNGKLVDPMTVLKKK